MNKIAKRIVQILGQQVRGQPFIRLGKGAGLSIATEQEVWPQLTSDGSPFPLVACSFDGFLANTAPNYYEAGKRYVEEHVEEGFILPTLEEFRRLHDFEDYSVLYEFGISRTASFGGVRESYLKILREVERDRPTRLNPWIPEILQDVTKRFHLVIVTSNRIHDIAGIIKNQAGIEKGFDVVTVSPQNTGLVLGTLADYHHVHHGSVRIHFPYFCSSVQDAASAQECGKWVKPFGVVDKNGHVNGDDYFERSLVRNGATLITPDQILPVVYGLHSLGCGKFTLS